MSQLFLAFAAGLATSTVIFVTLHSRLLKVGDKLYLSLDELDSKLLKEGKVCNARLSTVKELAEKSYGETGLSVVIEEKF